MYSLSSVHRGDQAVCVHSRRTELSFDEFQFLFVKPAFKENSPAIGKDEWAPTFSIISEFNYDGVFLPLRDWERE